MRQQIEAEINATRLLEKRLLGLNMKEFVNENGVRYRRQSLIRNREDSD